MKVITTEKLVKIKLCKCGCGGSIPIKDNYGRDHEYISGHKES